MIKQLKRNQTFFIPCSVCLTLATIFLFTKSKAEGFILMNSFHRPWLDFFFEAFTFLGDGVVCLATSVLLFILKKSKKATTLLLAFITSGLTAQVLKRIFHFPRPKAFFEAQGTVYSNFVADVTLSGYNSFPSGHTATAFALATCLVITFKKQRLAVPCLIGALIVAYSRVYLGQHFLMDVTLGASIGVFNALIAHRIVYKFKLLKRLKKLTRKPVLVPTSR